MNSCHNLLFALTVASASVTAQRSLLFNPCTTETTRSGSNGTSLATLRSNGIAVVTPNPAANYSAEVFGHSLALQTLAGDEDGDGDVHTPGLMGAIDAILVTPWDYDPVLGYRPRQDPVTLASVYYSPKTSVGTNVSGAPGLRPGDCGRFCRTPAGNGQVDRFISAEQIISALGMFDPATNQPLTAPDIDLDAITVNSDRDIFLSFEGDHMLRLRVGPGAGMPTNFALLDGGIAVIRAAAWTPDARGNVGAVTPQRGMIALSELDVHNLLVAAQATNATNNCVAFAGDTEGLAIDIDGGTFPVTWGGQVQTFSDLLIAVENLTGCGVITTRGVGQIADVNGQALATACGVGPTGGLQMGMVPSATMGYLDGLETLAREPAWFTLGSPSPTPLGGPVQVDIGTNLNTPFAFLGFAAGVLPVSVSQSFAPFSPDNLGFPELYSAILGNPFFFIGLAPGAGNARFGSLTTGGSPVIPPGILFQAFTVTPNGVAHLSTPLTLH